MPTKFQLITELYDQTVQNVTRSYESWTGFLRAACYNYKCPFDEQILIYAQRPDATAVLEMERWNRRFGRWVNRGAKSIAVFSDDGQNCLKLYFDVSDTHASRFARPLPIWTMQPAFEPEVIETLEATFGDLAEKENLVDAVRSACHNAVADNITDYLQDLCDNRQDSLLEELDDLNMEVFYRETLEVSVAYMLLTRLGLRADDYFSPDEFVHCKPGGSQGYSEQQGNVEIILCTTRPSPPANAFSAARFAGLYGPHATATSRAGGNRGPFPPTGSPRAEGRLLRHRAGISDSAPARSDPRCRGSGTSPKNRRRSRPPLSYKTCFALPSTNAFHFSMALTVWKLADSTISQQKVCQERLFDFCHCGILDASKNEEVRHAADIYRY